MISYVTGAWTVASNVVDVEGVMTYVHDTFLRMVDAALGARTSASATEEGNDQGL